MENLSSKSEEDDKKTAGSKKKRAGALGTFAIDSKPSPDKATGETESIWDKLTLTKRQAGETKEVVPLSEAVSRIPEVDEIEAPLETLSQPERQFAEREIIASQREAGSGQLAEGHETDDPVAAANAAVEQFRDKIIIAGQPVEQAFAETLQEIGESIDTRDAALKSDAETAVKPVEMNTPAAAGDHGRAISLGVDHENLPPGLSGEATDHPDPRSAATGGTPPPGNRFAPTTGNYLPPVPLPGTTAAKTEKEYVPYYNSGDVIGAALIGGIVGYLIGRRRGRIKTERKLRPIQKKLEKQVKDLRENIAGKEYHISKVAHQRARERQQMNKLETAGINNSKRIEALEASQLHGKKVAPEQIGRVLVTAREKPSQDSNKLSEKFPERRSRTDKRIETMSRAELLDLSENATVENTTLRQVYESHLVSEQGLRRLVSEYARGGDVQKALREELVEHEIDFERDPILRDRTRKAGLDANGGGKDALGKLLQKADVLSESQAQDELAVLKARQAHHENQRQHQQKSRRVVDTSMVAAIAVLFVLVVMLLLRGR